MRTSVKYRARWLFVQPRLIWATLIVLAAACFLAFWPPPSDQRIRFASLLLQIGGLATVAWGIHKVRTQFGEDPFLELVAKWWERRHARVVSGAAVLEAGSAMMAATGQAVRLAPTTLEQRVAYLEQDLAELTKRVDMVASDLRKEEQASKAAIAAESRERKKETGELNNQMKLFATGGIYVSMMGLVWLLFGITLATIPQEILAGAEWVVGCPARY